MLKAKVEKKFETQFTNDKFDAEEEIEQLYLSTFKDSITEEVNNLLYVEIVDNFGYEKSGTFIDAPSFLKDYYNWVIINFIETDLLPKFQDKFKVPNEKLWLEYL